MYCIHCGRQIADGAAYCIGCGAKVDQSTRRPQQPTVPPQQSQPTMPVQQAQSVTPQKRKSDKRKYYGIFGLPLSIFLALKLLKWIIISFGQGGF